MNKSERARLLGLSNRKHGQASPTARGPSYRSWETMKARCNNPNDPCYADYGGRGIKVCPRWETSFENFLEDLGERHRGTTLDRIDVNGDYEPHNCRWGDVRTQARNKRNNRMIQWQGKEICLVELSEQTGVPYQRLHERIVRRNWDVARAVSEAPRGFR